MHRRKFMFFTVMTPFLYSDESYSQKLPAIRFSPQKESTQKLSPTQLEDIKRTKVLEEMRKEPVDPVIKRMFGDIKPLLEGIKITLPKHSSNCFRVPINIISTIDAKRVVLFANPGYYGMSMIANWIVPENEMVDYSFTFKLVSFEHAMNELKKVKVVIEDRNGIFYMANAVTRVAYSGPEE